MGPKIFQDSNHSMMMASQPSLKRMIPQLLLSVSIFSFVFSYSFFTSSSYSPRFYYYFIENKLQLLFSNHAFNKNCLFLVCNGLLVLLAKTSGFNIDYPSGFDLDDMLQKKICGDDVSSMEQLISEAKDYEETLMDLTYPSIEEAEEPVQEQEQQVNETIVAVQNQWPDDDSEGNKQVSILIADDAEKDHETENDQKRSNLWLFDGDEDELLYQEISDERDQGKREDKRDLSTEELNQKFEEFIRKMKEEIIIRETKQNI